MSSFIKQIRNSDVLNAMISDGHHNEFILLTVIAQRARRTPCKIKKLEIGECWLGDFKEYGMTCRNYRTAKKNLENWDLATFKATNKGTVAKLVNTSIYDINIDEGDKLSDKQATSSRQASDKQPAPNKNVKKEKKEKKTTASLDYSSWPTLPSKELSDAWLELRKSQRAKLSQPVINRFGKELVLAIKQGFTVDQCFEMILYKGWRGFEAGWMKNTNVVPLAAEPQRRAL